MQVSLSETRRIASTGWSKTKSNPKQAHLTAFTFQILNGRLQAIHAAGCVANRQAVRLGRNARGVHGLAVEGGDAVAPLDVPQLDRAVRGGGGDDGGGEEAAGVDRG